MKQIGSPTKNYFNTLYRCVFRRTKSNSAELCVLVVIVPLHIALHHRPHSPPGFAEDLWVETCLVLHMVCICLRIHCYKYTYHVSTHLSSVFNDLFTEVLWPALNSLAVIPSSALIQCNGFRTTTHLKGHCATRCWRTIEFHTVHGRLYG